MLHKYFIQLVDLNSLPSSISNLFINGRYMNILARQRSFKILIELFFTCLLLILYISGKH